MTPTPAGVVRLPVPPHYDLAGTLGTLALGRHDPTIRLSATEAVWASRTPDGPATLHIRLVAEAAMEATAHGAGAGWALSRAAAIAGLDDDVTGFAVLAAAHPAVLRLARAGRGLRIPRTGRVFQHLVPTILGQKVTTQEALRAYLRLVRHFGEPAPGPWEGLLLPPDPALVAAAPYWLFHPFGVEQRRADTLRRAAARATALEAATDPAQATQRLMALPGIGPWTAAEVVRVAYGDPDVVTVGDFHLPHAVAWALAGEARATDARMLELLEPFRGHRGRVVRLIEAAGVAAPRFGPRTPIRSFAHF